jgi:hypothetical protein
MDFRKKEQEEFSSSFFCINQQLTSYANKQKKSAFSSTPLY